MCVCLCVRFVVEGFSVHSPSWKKARKDSQVGVRRVHQQVNTDVEGGAVEKRDEKNMWWTIKGEGGCTGRWRMTKEKEQKHFLFYEHRKKCFALNRTKKQKSWIKKFTSGLKLLLLFTVQTWVFVFGNPKFFFLLSLFALNSWSLF